MTTATTTHTMNPINTTKMSAPIPMPTSLTGALLLPGLLTVRSVRVLLVPLLEVSVPLGSVEGGCGCSLVVPVVETVVGSSVSVVGCRVGVVGGGAVTLEPAIRLWGHKARETRG